MTHKEEPITVYIKAEVEDITIKEEPNNYILTTAAAVVIGGNRTL